MAASHARLSVIVGLGNPGDEYADTRHNAGFRFLRRLAEAQKQAFRLESRFSSELAKMTVDGEDIWLLAPMTYMNRSGEAVARFMRYYKLPLSGLLVVHDEIDLPPGIVRLKRGGGDGGHNGLHDVIEKLGSKDFSRLRLGVGHPGHRDEVVNYVLKKPSATDQALLDLVIDKTLVELPLILSGQFERAMTVLHSQQP